MTAKTGLERETSAFERLNSTKQVDGCSLSFRRIGTSPWGQPNCPLFGDGTGIGIPRSPGNENCDVVLLSIEIDDFIELQRANVGGQEDVSDSELKRGASQSTREMARNSVENGRPDEIPTPINMIEEVDTEFTLKHQDGRSRALGAREGGATEVPVWIVIPT